MQNNNSSEILVLNKDLESYIFNSAKYYALKLVKNGFYSFYEVSDLEQEILALFYYRIKKYNHDESKSSIKYWINIIMEGIYGNLLEKAVIHNKVFSKKSLNDYADIDGINNISGINKKDSKEIIDFIEDNKTDTFESYCRTKQEELVLKAVDNLPNDLKELCRQLQADTNITDISKNMKLSRKTIYQKINKIKKIFEKLNLNDFF